MTNPMLAELDEVVRLSDAATGGNWSWSESCNIVTDAPEDGCDPEIAAVYSEFDDDREPANSAAICAAMRFLRTHHAEIADMAKRLEAAERDVGFMKVAETTLYQIATTPRNAGARRNANATMRFIETQRAAAIDATQEGEG